MKDIFKIILIVVLVILLSILGYFGYRQYLEYKEFKAQQLNVFEMEKSYYGIIKTQQDFTDILRTLNEQQKSLNAQSSGFQQATIKKIDELTASTTKLAETPKGDTLKTETIVQDDRTYQELKDLKAKMESDSVANEEEIAKLKEDISTERQKFLNASQQIYVRTKEGLPVKTITGEDVEIEHQKIIIYKENNEWRPITDNVEKIIEHTDVPDAEIIDDIIENVESKAVVEKKYDSNIKIGLAYGLSDIEDFSNLSLSTENITVSYELLDFWKLGLNATANLAFFEDFITEEEKNGWIGLDLGYNFKSNMDLAVGYNSNKDIYFRVGVEF